MQQNDNKFKLKCDWLFHLPENIDSFGRRRIGVRVNSDVIEVVFINIDSIVLSDAVLHDLDRPWEVYN